MSSTYSLGSTDAEHRRLIQLASHEEHCVLDACRRAGITEGSIALDLGCGPLGALAALAHVVGERGVVIGVDASEAALQKARSLLSIPHVRLVHADVHDIELEPADLAYSRLMLLHQADPSRTVRHIFELLKPGGVFIAHEASDLPNHAPSSEPHVPAMTRVWELVIGAARARGANPTFARNGRTFLEDAGFRIESHRAYAVHYPAATGYDIPRIALQSLRPVIAKHKLASEDEIAQLDRELEEAKQRADVQWVASPLMFEWIARKPY